MTAALQNTTLLYNITALIGSTILLPYDNTTICYNATLVNTWNKSIDTTCNGTLYPHATISSNGSGGISTVHTTVASDDYWTYMCRLQLCRRLPDDSSSQQCAIFFPGIFRAINPPHIATQSKVVLSICFTIILVLAVSGNILVILTFVFNRHMRSVTNVFIFSLAASDLVATVTRIPLNMGNVLSTYWTFGTFGCKLLPCITTFAVTCSSLTLCCITFDRYYAIVHPLKLKFVQTAERATVLQVIVWFISASLSIPYAFLYEIFDVSICKELDEASNDVCRTPNDRNGVRRAFNILILFLFIATFVCMTGMYSVVCFKLWIKRPIGTGVQKANVTRLAIKRKVVKMLIIVVLLFLVCWSPILSFNEYTDEIHVNTSAASLNSKAYLNAISLSSCCWNPIVYAFMNEKFRKAFKTLLTCRKNLVYPINIQGRRTDPNRPSTESRKTTTQREPGIIASGSTCKHTSETNV